jgi:hypothetical protein
VRRHFTLGEAAADTAATTAAAAAAASTAPTTTDRPVGRGLYDHAVYDDRKFFQVKPPKDGKDDKVTPPQRDIHGDLAETRIPVAPDDSVSMKRGADGHDEVIVRRPVTE